MEGISIIKNVDPDGSQTWRIEKKVAGRSTPIFLGKVYFGPHNNCQTYSIASVANILQQPDALEILQEVQKIVMKPMLLLDITNGNDAYFDRIFPKDSVVVRSPYKCTRNSDMILYLVKTLFLYKQNKNDSEDLPF